MSSLSQLGSLISEKDHLIFFGNQNCSYNDLKKIFKDIHSLEQVHGKDVVLSSSEKQKADAHYSDQKNCPLLIRTADCIPAFYASQDEVVALHIGWRGLAQRILTQATITIPPDTKSKLWIGPHIQKQSFELDSKNLSFLLRDHKISLAEALRKEIITLSHQQRDHYFVNLKQLLTIEANKIGIKKVEASTCNTFSSFEHFSFRRNRQQKNRNLSFIMKR